MPNKASKYCAAFPCNRMAINGAYCDLHRPAPAPKQTDAFYLSARWKRFRKWFIDLHPFCEQCLREGREVPGVIVDHIQELKDGGAPFDESNARTLCIGCHNRKTAAEANKRKNHQQSQLVNRTTHDVRGDEQKKRFSL